MPRMTPGYAKNTIRRALRTVVDPEPSTAELGRLWAHFSSSCAYCGRELIKAERGGHIDHLVSGATNHISNRVLACPPCNGDEKRESDWQEFLKTKCSDEAVLKERVDRIRSWCDMNTTAAVNSIGSEINMEIEQAVAAFDRTVQKLRQLRAQQAVAADRQKTGSG